MPARNGATELKSMSVGICVGSICASDVQSPFQSGNMLAIKPSEDTSIMATEIIMPTIASTVPYRALLNIPASL